MEISHANVVHQEIRGSKLRLYLNIEVDPESPEYNKIVVEEILQLAHKHMKDNSLVELELEQAIRQ